MSMYHWIVTKRNGGALASQDIKNMIDEYVAGRIPDYQMSAMLMAIVWRGMQADEVVALTMAMTQSGDMLDLSGIQGLTVDKHSTGGVGDKTTLILGPLVAACGGKVAKMSGRGLGHTGGTIDKLESIPGFQVVLNDKQFLAQVNDIGVAVIGQSARLAPADKLLYALRDVTGTVDSIPLIASSIMSKKLAAGSDAILLDVKVGSGAFMKNVASATDLAQTMIAIGEAHGRRMRAILTNMDMPLGVSIGNALEVNEAVQLLKGQGASDLRHECVVMASHMLQLSDKGMLDECTTMVEEALQSGRAYQQFLRFVEAQGGDSIAVDAGLPISPHSRTVLSPTSGYISHMDTTEIGLVSVQLGAGRLTKVAPIDYGAGIVMHAKTGDYVEEGQPLATLYTSQLPVLDACEQRYGQAIRLANEKPMPMESIIRIL